MRIAHLADLHIRCGSSRYEEYHTVFKRIVEALTVAKPACIVLAGDLFHSKLKIESPGLQLALEFFKDLCAIAHVVAIAGNHDCAHTVSRQDPNLIQVIANAGILGDRFHYLHDTGYHKIHIDTVDREIGFGLVAVQDTLVNAANAAMEFPPVPANLPASLNIALFHGPQYPSGISLQHGYNAVLLGDIHLVNVKGGCAIKCGDSDSDSDVPELPHTRFMGSYVPQKNAVMMAYSGSPIQQNHGEYILGHGFMLWDWANSNNDLIMHHYHVNNDYGFVTVSDANTQEVHVSQDIMGGLEEMEEYLPNTLSVRVMVQPDEHNYITTATIREWFKNRTITQITRIASASATKDTTNSSDAIDTESDITPLTAMNTPVAWHEFVSANQTFHVPESWFTNPEHNQIEIDTDDPALSSIVSTRNAKIMKKVREYEDVVANGTQNASAVGSFNCRYMEWDWILCYRDGNYFNFKSLENKLVAISARNGMGKTSFLETLCLALFGEGFPSRATKQAKHIVCADAPENATAQTTLYVECAGAGVFRICRQFNAVNAAIAVVDQVNITGAGIVTVVQAGVASGRPAVNAWVTKHLGTIDQFLMSSMITQNADMDFFALKGTEQRDMLDRALNIDTSTAFQGVLKESKLAHAAVVDALRAVIDSMNHIEVCPITEDDICALEERETSASATVNKTRAQRDHIKTQIATLPTVVGVFDVFDDFNDSVTEPTPEEVTAYREATTAYKQLGVDKFIDDYERPDAEDLADIEVPDAPPMTLEAIDSELRSLPQHRTNVDIVTEKELEDAQQRREDLMARPVFSPAVLVSIDDEDVKDMDMSVLPQPPTIFEADYETWAGRIAVYGQYYDPEFTSHDSEGLPVHVAAVEAELKAPAMKGIVAKRVNVTGAANGDDGHTHSHGHGHWIWKGDSAPLVNPDCPVCTQRVTTNSKEQQKAHLKWRLQCHMAALLEADRARQDEEYHIRRRYYAYHTAKWLEYKAELQQVNAVIKRAEMCKQERRRVQLEEWREEEVQRRLIIAWKLQDEIAGLGRKIGAWRAHLARELISVESALKRAESELKQTQLDLHDAHRIVREHAENTALYSARNTVLTALTQRLSVITAVHEAFGSFKSWLYTHRVLPFIATLANNIMDVICVDRPLQLVGDVNTGASGNTLSWFLIDHGATRTHIPIEKASGFQRFIAGMAVRLAIGRLMQSGVGETGQLFVDEGFVACDQENRARVGEFLKALPHRQIMIVSHLEDVNMCAQQQVNITREVGDQCSQLKVGKVLVKLANANAAPVAKKTTRTRKTMNVGA